MKIPFKQAVLNHLKRGERVTALKAAKWMDACSTKLTTRASELRAEGWPIVGEWAKTADGKRYMVYSMKTGAKQK